MRRALLFLSFFSALNAQTLPGTFTPLTLSTNNGFAPSTTLLTGFPTVSGGAAAQGYQGGHFFPPSATYPNGLACYVPWQQGSSKPHGTLLCYKGGTGGTFHCTSSGSCASNWEFFDMTTLTANATGFTCQGVLDNASPPNWYMIPGFDVAAHPVFVVISPLSSGGITNASNYQFFAAPSPGGALGTGYGWCTGVFDGRYVYYAPTGAGSFGSNSNVLRYDTTAGGGFVAASFQHVDISAFDANAGSFLSSTYDGFKYVYFLPVQNGGSPGNGDFARFDAAGAAAATCGSFTSSGCWAFFDMANLGGGGSNPVATGVGNLSSLQANAYYVGGQMVWDPTGTTEYMVMAPFATNPSGLSQSGQTLMSIVVRVPVGTCSTPVAGSQTCSGTFTAKNIFNNTTTWEYYDLAGLAANQEWLTAGYGWPPIYGTSSTFGSNALANQLVLGGFQLQWLNTHTTSDPIVGFVADFGSFYARFHFAGGKALTDPTAWDLVQRPASQTNGTMGGGYDSTNQILYPSSPAVSPVPSAWQLGPL